MRSEESCMGRNSRLILSALLAFAATLPIAAHAAAPPTVTTLTLSSPSVSWHTHVRLTGQVTAGGAPVTEGTVTFCDLSGPYTRCEDSAIVGKAQITRAGAQIEITPAIGTHKYTAIFNGTNAAAASTSAFRTLPVTGLYPTTTAIAATGNPSSYALTATVTRYASQPPVLAGSVSFEDTTANTLLGVVALGTPTFAQSYTAAPGSPVQTGDDPAIAGVGDF